MSDYCVVVVDGARARFFSLEPSRVPEVESGPRLVEGKGLINPECEIPGRELFADAKSGRNRAPGGPMHGYDDHRDNHRVEFERRFARRIAEETLKTIREASPHTVVMGANGRMLGILRREMESVAKAGVTLLESPRDLTKLSPAEIQEHLAKENLIPACVRPNGRTRG